MHCRLAAALATVLLLTSIGGAAAVEPGVTVERGPAPGVEPSGEPEPTPTNEPQPTTQPSPVAPSAEPARSDDEASPEVVTAADDAVDGIADPTGRWIVLYENGTNARTTTAAQASRLGFTPQRTFANGIRGFAGRLTPRQVAALRADPAVVAVVPDEKIELTAQNVPTGIRRSGASVSAAARVDGVDQRVDADVAIVDTGIAKVADLNVAGGYNCSTSDRALWRDVQGHGTHVAGTVGAIDNGSGVVGVAPGVRLWAVKILNDSGEGLLSWYICGLDWIAAQRDPADSSRPRFESVNMSVAKYGSDDKNCGASSGDVLHAAICRLVASGVTVVAAAANDSSSAAARVPAAYNEVITVSALADTDGKAGGLGGSLCYSWGTYDSDDTFANFSNYGSDVDLIAPGKCIWSTVPSGYSYSSGTSMAAPHVAGAAALIKADRPGLTPAEVKEALQYLGNLSWKITSDPDAYHEKLLDVTRVGPRGDFSVAAGPTISLDEVGGTAAFPITVSRSATSFERITFANSPLPPGLVGSWSVGSVYGFGAGTATFSVQVAPGMPSGRYPITVSATEHGLVRTSVALIMVQGAGPKALPPVTTIGPRSVVGTTSLPVKLGWPAATDATSTVAGYEIQTRINGGAWSPSTPFDGTTLGTGATNNYGGAYQYRVRARDTAGNWGDWATGVTTIPRLTQETATTVTWGGKWTVHPYAYALGGNERYATAVGASARFTATGRGIAIVGPTGPTRGSFRVIVDGVDQGTVSARSTSGQSRVVLYAAAFSAGGTHTVELRLVGNGRVDVDAFVALT